MKFKKTLIATAAVVASIVGPTVAASAQNSPCVTSAQFGTCTYGALVVNQDEWNPTTGSTQKLTATSASNWSVTMSEPGGAFVRNYPDVSQNLDGKPISAYNTLFQSFTDTPAMTSGNWETATDDWFNGTPGKSTTAATVELMIWTDNHGHTPPGTNVGTVNLSGQNFTGYVCTGACVQNSGIGHIFYGFVLQGNETTGQAHVVSALNWLEAHEGLSKSLPANQLDYGIEAGSITAGVTSAGKLTVTAYSNTIKEN